MQEQSRWIGVNNTLHVLIRSYVDLLDQVEDDDARLKLGEMAIDAHRQLKHLRQIFERRYGKELCPCQMQQH